MTHAQRIEAVCEQLEPPPHVAQLRRARQDNAVLLTNIYALRDQLADAHQLIDDLQAQLTEARLQAIAVAKLEGRAA